MSKPHNYSLSSCSSLQYHLDLYGKTQNIQIAGKDKQTTLIGSILGILSILAIIILSFYFLGDLFYRTNVKIMYNQDRDMIPNNNFSDSPIIFSLMDGDGIPIDKRLFDIHVQFLSYYLEKEEDGTVKINEKMKDIPYTNCNLNTSYGEYKNLFQDIPFMGELFCITPNSNNFTIHGKYSDIFNGFSYLNFYVNKCKNKTNSNGNKTCLSSEEIDYNLSNVYFIFMSLDSNINHNNSTQVYRKVMKSNSFLMSSTIHKRYYYHYRQVLYNTDYGLVFQDNLEETFYQQEDYHIDDKLPDNTTTSFSDIGTFSIVNDNKVDVYYRSYEKLQNIIANIGGVVKGILVTAYIINYILTRNYSSLILINSIFDFEESKKEVVKSIPIVRNILQLENQNNLLQSSKDHISLNCNLSNDILKIKKSNYEAEAPNRNIVNVPKIPTYMKKNSPPIKIDLNVNVNSPKEKIIHTKLKIKLISLILPTFCSPEKKKLKILENSVTIINEYLSIHNIMEKFFELEKIKQIILQEESQIREFYQVNKPQYKEEIEKIINKKLLLSSKNNLNNFEIPIIVEKVNREED